jgi:hypothetical protein
LAPLRKTRELFARFLGREALSHAIPSSLQFRQGRILGLCRRQRAQPRRIDCILRGHRICAGPGHGNHAPENPILYEVGQLLIGLYLHSADASAVYSAAGGLIVVLLWIYYSAQVFLLGAEFTKIYATRRGSRQEFPTNSPPKTTEYMAFSSRA